MPGEGLLANLLTDEQQAQVRNQARSRRYEVLLGAGASLGAKNNRGWLPAGPGLVTKLVDRYKEYAPLDSKDGILRCYQRAVTATSEADVYTFLRSIFNGADHEEWFQDATCFPWRRVWTLNIDDTFERAYQARKSHSHPALKSISWNDPFVDEPSNLQLIHLHGKVDSPELQPVVFSFSEYSKKATDKVVWDQVLSSVYSTAPFVIIGAAIFGDPDVEAVLLNRTYTAHAPSFVVSPNISDGNKWELEKNGLIVVRSTAEQFFQSWRELCEFGEDLGSMFVDASLRLPQLEPLRLERPGNPGRTHDYFAGDAPVWADAIEGRIAEFGWMKDAYSAIEAWSTSPDSRLIKVVGNRFGGTSSGLLNLTKFAANLGVRCYWFDRSSRFDPTDLVIHARSNGPLCVVVDSAADYADDIDRALRNSAEDSGAGLLFIISEISRNTLRLDGRLHEGYEIESVELKSRLSRRDARTLAVKIFENARAGEYEADKTIERMASMISKNDAFSAMLNISGGNGFLSRVRAEMDQLNAWQQKLLLLLQIASADQLPVAASEAQFAIGISSDVIMVAVRESSALSALVEESSGEFVARQRDKALATTLDVMGHDDAFKATISMVRGLHPLVQRTSVRARNRAALLVGHIMSVRFLRSAFPKANLSAFYDALQIDFGGWSGQYWEQRALLYKSYEDWSRAESYASRAVTLYDSPYTRTTLGTILVNRSVVLFNSGDSRWHSSYLRGKDELEHAQSLSEEKYISRFAYLTATIELLEALKSGANDSQSELGEGVYADWSENYNFLRVSIGGRSDAFDASRRSEILLRRFERVAKDADQSSDSFTVGHAYTGRVVRVYPDAVIVESEGIGLARLRNSVQRNAPHPLPNRLPSLSRGDVVEFTIIKVGIKTSIGQLVRCVG